MYNKYSKDIIKNFNLEPFCQTEKNKIISQFVVPPDKNNPPAHTTGSAIDLTLVKDGIEVDMGCSFDEFSACSYTNYYKDRLDTIHSNRKILYNCMIKAGFTNISTEYWHYDYGNRNWSIKTNQKVIFNDIIEKGN